MMVTQFKLKKGVEPDLLPPTRKFRQGGGGGGGADKFPLF